MKTTLMIDDDVSASLECLRSSSHAKLDAIVNDILRSGLKEIGVRPAKSFDAMLANPAVVRAVDSVMPQDALGFAEGEAVRW